MYSENRDCSGLIRSFLDIYQNADGDRKICIFLEEDNDCNIIKEMGKILVDLKNHMGLNGDVHVDLSELQKGKNLHRERFDLQSKQSIMFVLGSANCTVSVR